MKKILGLLVLVVTLSSCSVTQSESMGDKVGAEITTVQMLENVDTMQVAIIGNEVFLLEDNLVVGNAVFTNKSYELIHFGVIVAFFWLAIAIFGVLLLSLT